jgi:hypothetical protein
MLVSDRAGINQEIIYMDELARLESALQNGALIRAAFFYIHRDLERIIGNAFLFPESAGIYSAARRLVNVDYARGRINRGTAAQTETEINILHNYHIWLAYREEIDGIRQGNAEPQIGAQRIVQIQGDMQILEEELTRSYEIAPEDIAHIPTRGSLAALRARLAVFQAMADRGEEVTFDAEFDLRASVLRNRLLGLERQEGAWYFAGEDMMLDAFARVVRSDAVLAFLGLNHPTLRNAIIADEGLNELAQGLDISAEI